MSHPLHIKGARVWDGEQNIELDLFIKNRRIVSEKPNNALMVDLEGYTLFPGLVNAHDHLELNHFPRTKFREVYDNAHQWGEDVNARLNDEPFKTLRSYPIWDRVFIGGLKNLLCGATTVIHHGPKYREMYRRDFPVRVLKNYGWAHSLHFDTEEEIVKSYQSTPKEWPWFIHLAEGTDEVAAVEVQRLDKLGALAPNTVLVHGIGMSFDDIQLATSYYDGRYGYPNLVWCPSSNYYLFGNKAHSEDITASGGSWYVVGAMQHMIGSDSRLTAEGDFLDEIRYAFTEIHWVETLLQMNLNFVYPHENITNLPSDYFLVSNDFINTPTEQSNYERNINKSSVFRELSRKDLVCVMRNGIPQIGDLEIMAKFPHVQTVACTLDSIEKRMNIHLAKQVHRCKLKERGLEVDDLPQGKRFWFF